MSEMNARRGYRPRWQAVALTFTLPIWIIPALLWVGWQEAGREVFREIYQNWRWLLTGKAER